jgi:hypothetical protein
MRFASLGRGQKVAHIASELGIGHGSVYRALESAGQAHKAPGVVLSTLDETIRLRGFLSPNPRIRHFAVPRVLLRGMWGMQGMFLAARSRQSSALEEAIHKVEAEATRKCFRSAALRCRSGIWAVSNDGNHRSHNRYDKEYDSVEEGTNPKGRAPLPEERARVQELFWQ